MQACREKSWKDLYNNAKNQIMQELNVLLIKDKKKVEEHSVKNSRL